MAARCRDYAAGDTRLPLNCELIGSLCNAVLLGTLPFVFGLTGIAIAALGGALVTGLLLMRRQALLRALPWRSHWLLASLLMVIAALLLHPLQKYLAATGSELRLRRSVAWRQASRNRSRLGEMNLSRCRIMKKRRFSGGSGLASVCNARQQISHHPTGQTTDADALRQGAFYRFGTADLTHIFQVMQVPEQQVLDLLAGARPMLGHSALCNSPSDTCF